MNRLAMSPAASGLLRSLIARSGAAADRILLVEVESRDWCSLTFAGERHLLDLRIPGPGSEEIVERLSCGLQDAEFNIPGAIVADVAVVGPPKRTADGSTTIRIEALTLAAD